MLHHYGITAKKAGCFLVAALLFLPGCYSSKFVLGSADSSKVDRALFGDFVMTTDKGDVQLTIRNLDDHQCLVEWTDGKETERLIGYFVDVRGRHFAELREITDNGSIPDEYQLVKFGLSPDHQKITVQNLSEDFMKSENVDSSFKLKVIIEANLDNPKMYDAKPIVATRKAAATQP